MDVAVLFSTNGHFSTGELGAARGRPSPPACENVVPVLRGSTADRHGARLVTLIDGVSARLTLAELTGLNRQVDIDGVPHTVAARYWLRRHGLV